MLIKMQNYNFYLIHANKNDIESLGGSHMKAYAMYISYTITAC